MSESNQIQSLEFQLEIPSKAHNKSIQDKVVTTFNYRLQAMLDDLMASFSMTGNDIGFERIELSLEPIPLDALEDELIRKTEVALRDYFETAFEQLYNHKNQKTYTTGVSSSTKQLYNVTKTATLTYFLTYGHYPWWEKELNLTLSQRWMTALQKEKKLFTTQLSVFGKKSQVLKRMAYQLPDDALRSTVTVIEPAGANSVFTFHDHLKKQHQKKPVSSGISSSNLSKSIWEFTLTYLFVEMGSAFNQKMFLKSQVKQIAHHYNTSYQTILTFLNKGLKRLAENDIKRKAMFLTLKELGEELVSEEKQIKTDADGEDLVFSLKKLLKKHSYTKKEEKTLAYYITQLRSSERNRKQLGKQLSPGEFHRLVDFIVPQEKSFINEYLLKTEHSYKENPVPGALRDNFMRSIRAIVLNYLLIENTTVFNRKMFLKNQIFQIARHYNMSNNEVLEFLAYGFREIKTSNQDKTGLLGILKTLLEENSSAETETAKDITPSNQHKETLELLQLLISRQTLSVKEHELLVAIIKHYWQNNHSELITTWTDRELLQLLHHFAPGHHDFIKEYAAHITSLHSKVFSAPSLSSFKHRVWYFIIAGLTTGKRSQFNSKAFMEGQLKKLASHFTVEYIAILFHFMENMDAVSDNRGISSLKDTLATLYIEHHVTPVVFRKIAEKTDFSAFITQIVHFLQFGSYPPHSPHMNRSVLEQIFMELLLNYREKLLAALKKHGLAYQKNIDLPGIAFFPAPIIAEWEQFKKAFFTAEIIIKNDAKNIVTDAQYKNILAFYLKTGTLPWWSGSVTLKKIIKYLISRPETFRSFIHTRQWTISTMQRIYSLFDGSEREKFLHIIIEEQYIKAGMAVNKLLKDVFSIINYNNPDEAFLLFALQHIKKPLSPEQFAAQYLKQFSEAHKLNYDALIIKASARLENGVYPDIKAFFEKEKDRLLHKNDALLRKKLLPLYDIKEHTKAQLENLSVWIKKQDRNTVARLLSDWAGSRKKMPGIAVLQIFLAHLHEKNHPVTNFFSEIEQLLKIRSIQNAFPGFYDDVLQFYIDYTGVKKMTVFNFNEFILQWFAYMQRKDSNKTTKLAELLKKHLKKDSLWAHKFMIYTSGTLPATKSRSTEKDDLTEELPIISEIEPVADRPADALTEKVLVFNSGLVLLWPFLNHCFKTLQYLKGIEFASPEMQERAIHLLHYAATGQYENTGEEHLVINKILCGFPVTQPLTTTIIPTKQEKELVESMLKAIIARWSKIGNTSIDGLRGSYIIREGHLEEEKNGYQLQIEKKGYDMLLDYLPWKLELIKLPWMNKPLYISWR